MVKYESVEPVAEIMFWTRCAHSQGKSHAAEFAGMLSVVPSTTIRSLTSQKYKVDLEALEGRLKAKIGHQKDKELMRDQVCDDTKCSPWATKVRHVFIVPTWSCSIVRK